MRSLSWPKESEVVRTSLASGGPRELRCCVEKLMFAAGKEEEFLQNVLLINVPYVNPRRIQEEPH